MTDNAPTKYERLRPWIVLAIVWVVAFDIAWLWQRASGAHVNEFGANPREGTLYVTGMMLRDFMVSASPNTKAHEFIQNFVAHYPIADAELWPPFFHALECAWMAAFGTGRIAMLMLMAALAALGATVLWDTLAKEFGHAMATLGALTLLCLPLFRESYSSVLAEPLAAILLLSAALKWGRYLEEGRAVDAIAFGVLCGLALLTDLSALALLLQAPISALIARRGQRLRQLATWAGITLAALIAAPVALSLNGVGNARSSIWNGISWEFARGAEPFYFGKLAMGLGFFFVLFFVIGLICQFRSTPERSSKWITLAVTLAAAFAIRAVIIESLEARRLVPLLPIAVMFVIAGFGGVFMKFSKATAESLRPSHIRAACLLAIAGVITAQMQVGTFVQLRWTGYGESAQQIVDTASKGPLRILLSSDAAGQSALITELAKRDKRRRCSVQYSNRELSHNDRILRATRPRFDNSEDLAAWFPGSGYALIALDQSIPEEARSEVHDQLLNATANHPEIFWPMAQVKVGRGSQDNQGVLTIYRLRYSQNSGN
jgi:hypothetical protein